MDNTANTTDRPEDDEVIERESIERLAKILHESGREAVAQRKIYRSDLPVKPFAEWNDLDENTKEGRRMMARYVRERSNEVVECLSPVEI